MALKELRNVSPGETVVIIANPVPVSIPVSATEPTPSSILILPD